MPPSIGGHSVCAAERITANKLEAIRTKMPSVTNNAQRVEAKYDVVLDFPNLELHSAAASGNLGLVHYALTHGQPVNSLLHGCLPLHAACSGGSVSVVRMLIDRGADVNAPRLPRRYSDQGKRSNNAPAVGTVGSTPLHFAAANGHTAVVQILLGCGAEANKRDKNGMTPEDLAEMSGFTEVVNVIRIWSHVNDRPGTAMSDASQASTSADAGPSNGAGTPSETDSGPLSRKGKERATSMASVASEKARSLRTSFENGMRGGRSSVVSPSPSGPSSRAASFPSDDTPPSGRPDLSLLQTPHAVDSDSLSSTLPSPFAVSPSDHSPVDDEDEHRQLQPNGIIKTPVMDQEFPSSASSSPSYGLQRERSSRRPSLPAILEKAAHPGLAFRNAMRITEKESPPSITESEHGSQGGTPPLPSTGMFSRGRAKTVERTKSQKRNLLRLFRRGQSPPSRSPSPPRRSESGPHPAAERPSASEQLEESIAKLKRASMDPEMMQMAMAVVQLGDQLEAAAAISAPVTKTHFFEDLPSSPSSHSVSSDRQVQKIPPPPPIERGWDPRRGRNGVGMGGVISPSPLAHTWGDDSDDEVPRRAVVRRSVTEVYKKDNKGPRRIPSLPAMAGSAAARRRSKLLLPTNISPPTDASGEPTSDSGSLNFSDEIAIDSASATEPSPSEEKSAYGVDDDQHGNDDETAEREDDEEDPDATITAPPRDLPSLMLREVEDGDEVSGTRSLPSTSYLQPEEDTDQRRFRGESVSSSQLTDSVVTPPQSRVMTPPGSGVQRVSPADVDLRSLGLLPASPETALKRTSSVKAKAATMSTLGSGLPSERLVPSSLPSGTPLTGLSSQRMPLQRSMSQRSSSSSMQRSTSQRSTSHRSTLSLIDGAIPEGRPMRHHPQRKISSHAEARDAMEQDERDVLSIAQLPHSELSSRTLADQLAAYGESHALAQEFARVERLSSASSSSSRYRNSSASTSSADKRLSGSSSTSKANGLDAGVGRIYDRRADGYRERMGALSSASGMYGLHQRSMSSGMHPRSRATSASDTWLNSGSSPGPGVNTVVGVAHPRRLTDPSGPKDLSLNSHVSRPLSSMKAASGLGLGSSHHGSVLSHVPRRNGSGGLMRASSLSSHADGSPRYQGLAQARAFANAQSSKGSSSFQSSSLLTAPNIMASRQPHPRSESEEEDDDDEPPEPPFNVVEVGQWHGVAVKSPNKWGQFKGAVNHRLHR